MGMITQLDLLLSNNSHFLTSLDDHARTRLDGIYNDLLKTRITNYSKLISRKLMMFLLSQTLEVVNATLASNKAALTSITESQSKYESVFEDCIENAVASISQLTAGNYQGLVKTIGQEAISLFKSDHNIRDEIVSQLQTKNKESSLSNFNDLLTNMDSVNDFLSDINNEENSLESTFQSLFMSGTITQEEYKQAVEIINKMKFELVDSIDEITKENEKEFTALRNKVEKANTSKYAATATKIIGDFAVSKMSSARINSFQEVRNLLRKFTHFIRDHHIKHDINRSTGVKEASRKQGRVINLAKSSMERKAITAILKRYNITEFNPESSKFDEIKSRVSRALDLVTNNNRSYGESLEFYADYYLNQVDREAYIDANLFNQILPPISFFEKTSYGLNKQQGVLDVLNYLSSSSNTEGEYKENLSDLKIRIDAILNYYYNHLYEKLLHSEYLQPANEELVAKTTRDILNRELSSGTHGSYFRSYLGSLANYIGNQAGRGRITLEEPTNPNQVKIVYSGKHFEKLNLGNSSYDMEQEIATLRYARHSAHANSSSEVYLSDPPPTPAEGPMLINLTNTSCPPNLLFELEIDSQTNHKEVTHENC